MGTKLKRNMSGFFEVPYEQTCISKNEDGEFDTCSCVMTDKFYIREVLYNDPVTVVFWSDNTKTVAKAYGNDKFSKETGLSVCILKKFVGGGVVKELMEDWVVEGANRVTISDVRKSLKVSKVVAEEVAPKEVEKPKKSASKASTTKKATKKK